VGQTNDSLQQLDLSGEHVEEIRPGEDFYWTEFQASLLDDFRGDCYLQLHRFSDAQNVFQEALTLGKSSSLRHQSSVTIGLAEAMMQQGELEQSCALAGQALALTHQTQSWMILQYVHSFRDQLDQWKNEPCVKDLDEQIAYLRAEIPRFSA
ncbi:MAG TPA: hypothetical protein VHD63_21540, partial [Ktedonobacteraceae bacterium]|nr:hypothetical protein [Ktedonobacteraceae bacterium]